MGNSNNVNIKSLTLVPTQEAYKDPYLRSYNLNVTHDDLNALENIFERNGVQQNNLVNETAFANDVPNIMGISGNVLGAAKIANGWGIQRLRYVMITETPMGSGMLESYIQGYTEYHDPSISGAIDPRMKFYINSVTNVMRVIDHTTNAPIVMPQSTFNVIADHLGNAEYQDVTEPHMGLQLIRPSDIINGIQNMDMYGGQTDTLLNNNAGNYAGNTAVSDRANSDPLKHFTTTVNSYIKSMNTTTLSHNPSDVVRNASNFTGNTNILTTPIIAALYNITGLPTPTEFTLDTLSKVTPDIGARTYMPEQNYTTPYTDASILNTNDTEEMWKNTIESTMAVNIVQSVSGMLIDNLLSGIDFSVTNMGGQPLTTVTNAFSFIDGIDLIPYVNKVETRINHILFPEISKNGGYLLNIFVHSDLLGDSSVSISVNNAPPTVFRFPTFADSLYSPVISDADNKGMMTNDFNNVFDRVMPL